MRTIINIEKRAKNLRIASTCYLFAGVCIIIGSLFSISNPQQFFPTFTIGCSLFSIGCSLTVLSKKQMEKKENN